MINIDKKKFKKNNLLVSGNIWFADIPEKDLIQMLDNKDNTDEIKYFIFHIWILV